ncbi:hypothetical protein BDV93DRAFT_318689 [Ceratobasidium sp. AG-I]|nr:hypothetical protein BDV93DRAFT_318689 [Ceratobasidium sp. AG-I]
MRAARKPNESGAKAGLRAVWVGVGYAEVVGASRQRRAVMYIPRARTISARRYEPIRCARRVRRHDLLFFLRSRLLGHDLGVQRGWWRMRTRGNRACVRHHLQAALLLPGLALEVGGGLTSRQYDLIRMCR